METDLSKLIGKRFLAKRKKTGEILEFIGKEYSPNLNCIKVDVFIHTVWLVNDDQYEILDVLE